MSTFTEGCCYWFSIVLKERFSYLDPEVMYDQVKNHFGCKIDGHIYDITGDVTFEYAWENWIEVSNSDMSHAERIKRDCINF